MSPAGCLLAVRNIHEGNKDCWTFDAECRTSVGLGIPQFLKPVKKIKNESQR
jgi:hypothetical protein